MSADVRSIDAVQRVRDELARFAHRATDGLDELSAEIYRVIDWVEHDRPGYWKMRVRKAYDELAEAKAALQRCLMYPINDETPSCAEERAAVKKAEANLRLCQEKQQRVRKWSQKLRHEVHEYQGRIAALKRVVELDNPKAVSGLERALATLEEYLTSAPPTGPAATSEPSASNETGEADPPTEDPA